MRIDVLLGEGHVSATDVAGRVVVVIDVLRAATTVATALANGARAVIPFEQVDEVAVRARQFERSDVLLGGERRMQRIPGFDLGNSPEEYTGDTVGGRTILYSTTNGTSALVASQHARVCLFAGLVNVRATIVAARAAVRDGGDVTIVCAGADRRAALEDIVCAGLLVRGIARARPNVEEGDAAFVARTLSRRYDGNLTRIAADSAHARTLTSTGYSADVARSISLDSLPIAIAYRERQLVRHDQPRPARTHRRLTDR